MKDLDEMNDKKVKRAAAAAEERDEYFFAEGQGESKQKAKSSQRAFGKLKEGGSTLGRKSGERGTVIKMGR